MRHPITLEAFADWVERQPPGKDYAYQDPDECAFCQYLHHLGHDDACVTPDAYCLDGRLRMLPEGIDDCVRGSASKDAYWHEDWTFGKLAVRLRERLTA